MNLYTIGFTKKSAERFFGLLRKSGATTLVDVRLNNVSQLAGFAKRDDLTYFLSEICGMAYAHQLDLAPTQPMLDDYKKQDLRPGNHPRHRTRACDTRSGSSGATRSSGATTDF